MPDASDRLRLTYGLIYALFFVLSILPIWTVHHPPLQDYPNHLARAYILSHGDRPPLSQFYAVDWDFVPNLAMDLVVPVLALFLPLHVTGKLFLTLTFFVLTFGALLLSRTVFGRLTPLPFLSFLLLYNMALHKGFLNFLFSCGFAFLSTHLWIRCSSAPAWRRIFLGTCNSALLFFAHLYGLVIYAFFTFAYEALAAPHGTPIAAASGNAPSSSPRTASGAEAAAPAPGSVAAPSQLIDAAVRLGIWLPQFVLPAVLFFSMSPTSSGLGPQHLAGQIAALVTADHWLLLKLAQLRLILQSYNPPVDLAVALFMTALVIGICVLFRRSMPKHFLIPLLIAFVVYLFIPRIMLTSVHADWRLLVPLGFITVAALPYPFTGRYASAAVFSVIAVLLALQTGAVAAQWQAGERLYRNYQEIITRLPYDVRLFTYSVCSDYGDLIFPTPVLHLNTLSVIDRHAFVPSLFAHRTQQVLRYRDDYGELQRLSSRIFYGVEPLDWNYAALNYEYALNIDQAFDQDATCRPPPDWQVIAAAGRLTLLRRIEGAAASAEPSATGRRRSGPRPQPPDG